MQDQKIFLSYSRQQLHFAESLVFELQQRGFDVWFDLQRLTPGVDWQREIQAGLQACDQLVLIVSQAALASRYVQLEWSGALQAGKPVYLVWFEAADLPPKLASAPSFDLSSDFDRGIYKLAYALQNMETLNDPSPEKLGWLPHARQLPGQIHQVATFFLWLGVLPLLLVLACGWLPTISAAIWGIMILLGIAISAALFRVRQRFLLHKIGYQTIRRILQWNLAFYSFILFLLLIAIFQIVGLVLLLPALVGLRKLDHSLDQALRSPAVLRWMPKGGVPPDLRSDMLLKSTDPSLGSPVSYRLQSARRDRRVAAAVERAMEQAGHKRVNTTQHPAHYQLLVITRHAAADWLQQFGSWTDGLIPIIASTVDLERSFPGLEQYQLVDYRRRDPDLLSALARYLRNPGLGGREFGVNVTPESLQKRVVPTFTHWIGSQHLERAKVGLVFSLLALLLLSSIWMLIVQPKSWESVSISSELQMRFPEEWRHEAVLDGDLQAAVERLVDTASTLSPIRSFGPHLPNLMSNHIAQRYGNQAIPLRVAFFYKEAWLDLVILDVRDETFEPEAGNKKQIRLESTDLDITLYRDIAFDGKAYAWEWLVKSPNRVYLFYATSSVGEPNTYDAPAELTELLQTLELLPA